MGERGGERQVDEQLRRTNWRGRCGERQAGAEMDEEKREER